MKCSRRTETTTASISAATAQRPAPGPSRNAGDLVGRLAALLGGDGADESGFGAVHNQEMNSDERLRGCLVR